MIPIDRRYIVWMAMIACLLAAGPVPASSSSRAPAGQQKITDRQFLSVFTGYIQDREDRSSEDMVISRFRVLGNKPVPAGHIRYRVDPPRQAALKGLVRLGVLIAVDGIVRHRVTLQGWVEIYEPVVFAKRDLKRGEPVGRGDLYAERVNIARMPDRVLTDTASAVGYRCKHSIRAGTAVKEWMLERTPVVSRGDRVVILAESAGIRVTVPGRIMETGYENERVAVENTMSRKKIFARVVDSATVVVDY